MSEWKPFTGVDDRVCLADVVPLDTPFTINVFPANVCNFRCQYCAQSRGAAHMKQEYDVSLDVMSMEVIECLAEQICDFPHPIKLISMMGHGEPLCNPELPEMIAHLKQKAGDRIGRIDIITNASLLTPDYGQKLLDAGLDVLRVSLQGISSESYQKICGVSLDFTRFYENLAWFYAHKGKCQVYVKTMDVALKSGEEEEFRRLFEPISDRIYIDQVKPVYDTVTYSAEQADISVDRYGNTHEHRFVCSQPFYMFSVWPDGMITPCDALYHASPLGNLTEQPLMQLWNSPQHRNFCRMQLEKKRGQHPACKRCCAPDDVIHESDILDFAAPSLLKKFT